MYFYTYDELIEFFNDFDSHWAHGSVPLRECCRPSNWREILGKWDEEGNKPPVTLHGMSAAEKYKVKKILMSLHLSQDELVTIEEMLPGRFFELSRKDRLQLYQTELRNTHQELNHILDLYLEWFCLGWPSQSCLWFDLLCEAPFDLTRFASCSVAAEQWSLKALVPGKEKFITGSANMVYLTPDFGNYYLTFLNLINERRSCFEVDRCQFCGCVKLRKRKTQRFCSSKCRSSYHNSQKDSAEHAAYMRDWRRKEKLREAKINRRLAASLKRD